MILLRHKKDMVITGLMIVNSLNVMWNFVAIGVWRLCPPIESNKGFRHTHKKNPEMFVLFLYWYL